MKPFPIFLVALALSLPASAETGVWKIDPASSSAHFSVRHMMVSKVKGSFEKVTGRVTGDLENPATAKVVVTIDASSIDTDNADRDDHLRSADFLEVAKHPEITFASTRIEPDGRGWRMRGNLTIRGVTREVVLAVKGPSAAVRRGDSIRREATATTRINRKDFGLTWNRAIETGGVVVGDDVDITIEVALVQQAQ
ncbi:MAG TPA: YceI family protein [Thermoanaerobaculia bacterium]|nr:YceI family protein [Thermoanaerobaculia bacterium]